MMPILRPEGAAPPADGGGLVAVDATSGAGGLRVDPAEFDAYYFAPQKCFGSDGGLWVALLSPAAVERIGTIAATGRWVPASMDLTIALDNSRSTRPTTRRRWPPSSSSTTRCAGSTTTAAWSSPPAAATARPRSSTPGPTTPDFATPFVDREQDRSHVIGTIDFDDSIDAAQVAKMLRANGIVDTEPYRKLGRNQLRIAMFPAIDPEDIAALCACITHVVGALAQ